jgi:hypothetical protein
MNVVDYYKGMEMGLIAWKANRQVCASVDSGLN